ncbi:MAG: LuxR C-terminal-related transcriptional regulator [Solirubrobacteraceae bacterium]
MPGWRAKAVAELFISPHTVEWHLRKVFSKLGLAARKELREAVPRSGAWASPPGTRSPQPADRGHQGQHGPYLPAISGTFAAHG